MANSLLAHVADHLTRQRELLATRSLAYILESSEAAKSALQELLCIGRAQVGTIERVDTEVADNQGRVDLVAFNEAGEERVLIEAKFSAGLTDNQPEGYLKRLPQEKPAVLLFLAPKRRLHTLWSLLRQRAPDSVPLVKDDTLRSATIAGTDHYLMLTSWCMLLARMECRAGDGPTGEDIRQLRGLCDREDAEAFSPLKEPELRSQVPRRLRDLARIVNEAIEILVAEGFANRIGQSWRGTESRVGTKLRLGSKAKDVWAGAWFGVHYDWWRETEGCPLWIEIKSEIDGVMPYEEAEEKLGYWSGWIDLPTDKEYGDVLDSVVDDLRKHARRLAGEMDDDEWAEYMAQQTG